MVLSQKYTGFHKGVYPTMFKATKGSYQDEEQKKERKKKIHSICLIWRQQAFLTTVFIWGSV